MDILIERERKALEQAVDIVTMHRSQGAIASYQRLKQLREYVNGSDT